MAILSFGFNKINVERKTKNTKQVNISSGLKILSVEESNAIKDATQKAFAITFQFDVNYEPDLGSINLEGELLYLAPTEIATKISDSWKKGKSLPQEVGVVIFNRILQQCNVEALILSREINLPAPIQLPKVRAESAPVTKKPTAKKNTPKK